MIYGHIFKSRIADDPFDRREIDTLVKPDILISESAYSFNRSDYTVLCGLIFTVQNKKKQVFNATQNLKKKPQKHSCRVSVFQNSVPNCHNIRAESY